MQVYPTLDTPPKSVVMPEALTRTQTVVLHRSNMNRIYDDDVPYSYPPPRSLYRPQPENNFFNFSFNLGKYIAFTVFLVFAIHCWYKLISLGILFHKSDFLPPLFILICALFGMIISKP